MFSSHLLNKSWLFNIFRLTIYSLWCNEPEEPKDDLDLGVERGIDEENNEKKFEFEMVDKPKFGIIFKGEHDIIAYYKCYAKQAGFDVKTQRKKRVSNGMIKYITYGCARGGKHKSRRNVVSKPCPTTN